MTSNIIENKNGLYDLIGVPKSYTLPGDDDTTILIYVDPANTEEKIFAYAKQVRDLLPNNRILVLPNTVRIECFPNDWQKDGVMIAQQLKKGNKNDKSI